MLKSYNELVPNDFAIYKIWYEDVKAFEDDDIMLRPLYSENLSDKIQYVVPVTFFDTTGNKYKGHMFWNKTFNLEICRPVIFFDDAGNKGMEFWNDYDEPPKIAFKYAKEFLNKNSFPLSFETTETKHLKKLTGTLEGIYFYNQKEKDRLYVRKFPY